MKVATLNGTQYMVSDVEEGVLIQAMVFKGTLNLQAAKNYVQKENLSVLQNISFGNQVFTVRELTPVESGYFTIVYATLKQAEETAMATVVNARLNELLGEF